MSKDAAGVKNNKGRLMVWLLDTEILNIGFVEALYVVDFLFSPSVFIKQS